MPFPPFPENEMNNQAAQTMPELPKAWGFARNVDGQIEIRIGSVCPPNRSGGLATPWAPMFGGDQMHQYARDYAAMLATTPQPSADAVRDDPGNDPRVNDDSFAAAIRACRSQLGARRPDDSEPEEQWMWDKLTKLESLLSAASGEGVDDTKRLDWIARQGGYEFDFGILNDQPGDGDWFVHGMGGSGQGATFRDAIDAAIKEEAGGQDANTDILDTLAFKTENGYAGRGSVTYIASVASCEADHQQNAAQGGGK